MKYLALVILLTSALTAHAQEEVKPGQLRVVASGAVRIASVNGSQVVTTDGYHYDISQIREMAYAYPSDQVLVRHWDNGMERSRTRQMQVERIKNVIRDSEGHVIDYELATDPGMRSFIDPVTARVNKGAARGEVLPADKVASRIRNAGRDIEVHIADATREQMFAEAKASGDVTALENILSAEAGRDNWLEVRDSGSALKDLGRVKALPNGNRLATYLEERLTVHDVKLGAPEIREIIEHAADGAARR